MKGFLTRTTKKKKKKKDNRVSLNFTFSNFWVKTLLHTSLGSKHRCLIEVDCSLGQIKLAKLKDKNHNINALIFFTTLQKKEEIDAPNF